MSKDCKDTLQTQRQWQNANATQSEICQMRSLAELSRSKKLRMNSSIFNWRLKDASEDNDLRDLDRLFHVRAAATGKARSPAVERRVGGTTSVDVADERRRWRAASVTRVVGRGISTTEPDRSGSGRRILRAWTRSAAQFSASAAPEEVVWRGRTRGWLEFAGLKNDGLEQEQTYVGVNCSSSSSSELSACWLGCSASVWAPTVWLTARRNCSHSVVRDTVKSGHASLDVVWCGVVTTTLHSSSLPWA